MPTDARDRRPEAGAAPAVSLRHLVGTLALSVGVLAVIGWATYEPEAFGPFLREIRPWWLVGALATVGLRVAFGAWRLHHFTHGLIAPRDAVRDQIVWDFFAYVTPSAVGGGPFLSVFIARDRQLPLGEATSVVLFAMLVDQIVFALSIPALLLASAYVEVFPQALGTAGTWALMALFGGYLVWVAALAYGTLFRPQHLARLVGRVFRLGPLRRFRERALGAMEDMTDRARTMRTQSAAFYAKGFALSLVPWLCRYALAVCVIASVYPAVDGGLAFLRAAALQIGAVAVPTPGGAGGVEGLYVLFLGLPLVPEAVVAPTLLVWRALGFYVFIAVGAALVAQHVRWRATADLGAGTVAEPERP